MDFARKTTTGFWIVGRERRKTHLASLKMKETWVMMVGRYFDIPLRILDHRN